MRAAVLTAAAMAAVAAGSAGRIAVADAVAPAPPQPYTVSPAAVVENGKPLRLVITGQHLAAVNAVVLDPPVASRSFTVLDDEVIQVVLPATTPPGDYSIRVLAPGAGSDPSADLEVVVESAPPPPTVAAAPVRPKYSFDPAPGYGPQSSGTGEQAARPGGGTVAAAAAAPVVAPLPGPAGPPLSPAMIVLAGLLAGGLGYALWGSAGRLAAARETGVLVQAVGRPAQRLRLGRVCVNCGRLYWRLRTRRDLWRIGDCCSVACVLDHGDALLEACHAADVASSRLRGMVRLESALASEAHDTAAAHAAYLPRLIAELEHAAHEEHLTGQPMAALLPAPELVPVPPTSA
jgi:hypothetical protein